MTGKRFLGDVVFRLIASGLIGVALLSGCKGSRDGDGRADPGGSRGNNGSGEEIVQPPGDPTTIPGTDDDPDPSTRPQQPPEQP